MSLFLSVDFGLAGAVDTAGARPYTGSNPQWNNVSLFLEGGVSQTQTKVGTDTTVKVRVSNSAAAAVEDVRRVVEQGLACIPAKSPYAMLITDLLKKVSPSARNAIAVTCGPPPCRCSSAAATAS